MPENPEIFQPMTNLKHFEQMTDIYGVAIDVHPVRAFRDSRELGAGYDLSDPTLWFVYDRESTDAKWHKHCGPYSTFEQSRDWITDIREEPAELPIPLSTAMLEAIRTWSANDRLWGSQSATEFNLCTFARVILKAQGEPAGILQLEEARMASLGDLRADIIRSAARGQGPTFIAAKLDILIAKATVQNL